MKKILVINLRRNGDLFFNAHLISSLLAKDPSSKIELLAFDEFKKATKNIKGISKIHTIDRKELLTISQNNMFSNAQALDSFITSLAPLKVSQWDEIINISNDKTSCYLTSYLSGPETKHSGIKFSRSNSVEASNEWAQIYNDLLPEYRYTPIHFNDIYHRICDTNKVSSFDKLAMRDKNTRQVFSAFNKIRNAEGNKGSCRVIGVQLKASHEDKELGFETTVEFINHILDDITLYPVMLIAPIEEERVYAKQVNKQFGNSLVVIESDFTALPSVIINLDALVTPDTVTKHIGDLVDTPILEVSLGVSPMLKQGSVIEGNLILTPSLDKREWKCNDPKSTIKYLKPSSYDIYNSLRYLLDPNGKIRIENPQFALYMSSKDSLGTFYKYISGARNESYDLSVLMSRYYLLKKFNISDKQSVLKNVASFSTADLKQWLSREKAFTTDASKELLGTLRSLLRTQKDSSKAPEFVQSLDKILKYTKTNSLSSIATIAFRARLESQGQSSIKESIKAIEKSLYQLKTDIQLIVDCTKDVETLVNQISKDEMISRVSSAPSV